MAGADWFTTGAVAEAVDADQIATTAISAETARRLEASAVAPHLPSGPRGLDGSVVRDDVALIFLLDWFARTIPRVMDDFPCARASDWLHDG